GGGGSGAAAISRRATRARRPPPAPRRAPTRRSGKANRRSVDTSTGTLLVSRLRGKVSPRYDVPKAAPEPLRQVQLLVNSADVEHGVDWLPDWLAGRGPGGELARARRRRGGRPVLRPP